MIDHHLACFLPVADKGPLRSHDNALDGCPQQ